MINLDEKYPELAGLIKRTEEAFQISNQSVSNYLKSGDFRYTSAPNDFIPELIINISDLDKTKRDKFLDNLQKTYRTSDKKTKITKNGNIMLSGLSSFKVILLHPLLKDLSKNINDENFTKLFNIDYAIGKIIDRYNYCITDRLMLVYCVAKQCISEDKLDQLYNAFSVNYKKIKKQLPTRASVDAIAKTFADTGVVPFQLRAKIKHIASTSSQQQHCAENSNAQRESSSSQIFPAKIRGKRKERSADTFAHEASSSSSSALTNPIKNVHIPSKETSSSNLSNTSANKKRRRAFFENQVGSTQNENAAATATTSTTPKRNSSWELLSKLVRQQKDLQLKIQQEQERTEKAKQRKKTFIDKVTQQLQKNSIDLTKKLEEARAKRLDKEAKTEAMQLEIEKLLSGPSN